MNPFTRLLVCLLFTLGAQASATPPADIPASASAMGDSTESSPEPTRRKRIQNLSIAMTLIGYLGAGAGAMAYLTEEEDCQVLPDYPGSDGPCMERYRSRRRIEAGITVFSAVAAIGGLVGFFMSADPAPAK